MRQCPQTKGKDMREEGRGTCARRRDRIRGRLSIRLPEEAARPKTTSAARPFTDSPGSRSLAYDSSLKSSPPNRATTSEDLSKFESTSRELSGPSSILSRDPRADHD